VMKTIVTPCLLSMATIP